MQIIALFLFLMLPWLNPFAPGPTPATVPLLFSWGSAAVALGMCWSGRISLLVERRVSCAAWAWLIAGILSGVMGLLQYFGVETGFSPWVSQTEFGQAFANLRQRNQFATLTSMALVALLWLTTSSGFLKRIPGCALIAAGLLAAANAASSSRTGMAELVLLCLLSWVWGWWRQPVFRNVLLTALVVYMVAMLLLPWLAGVDPAANGMLGRLRAGDKICASRLTLWSNVIHLIGQRPWLGWGWGELDYAHYMTLYPGARFCDILDNAHNLPLHLAVELGIPLAMTLCGTLGVIAWRAKPWRETDPVRQMAWGVLAMIMLHSMLEYPLWYGPFQLAFCLSIWMLWLERGPSANVNTWTLAGVAMPLVLVSVVLATIAYAAWDYHRISQIYRAPEMRGPAYRDDTIRKIRGSRLFSNQVRFAELTTTALRRDNAEWTFDMAKGLLHFSPEPRVIEKLIESAVMLGRDDEALLHLVRFRAAFPQDYEKWRHTNGLAGAPAD